MVNIALYTSVVAFAVSAFALPPNLNGANSISLLRRDSTSNYTDADILNYALTLEHLEATFYAQALSNYSLSDFQSAGFSNGTRNAIQMLADQEATHVSVITGALSAAGAQPVSACNYSFGVTDVKSFLELSAVLENVGVSAYLGAAPYITNPAYLTVAAAITTVEARHQAYVAYLDGEDPFPSPFDTAEGLRQIVTLAGAFITSCPDGSAPTLEPFPSLTLSGNATAGSNITVTPMNVTLNGTVYCAFTSGISPTNFTSYDTGSHSCDVPEGLVGQTYVVLTNSNSSLTDDDTLAGPAILALGPGNMYSAIVDSPSATSTKVPSGSGLGGNPSPSNTDNTKKSAAFAQASVAGSATLAVAAALGVILML